MHPVTDKFSTMTPIQSHVFGVISSIGLLLVVDSNSRGVNGNLSLNLPTCYFWLFRYSSYALFHNNKDYLCPCQRHAPMTSAFSRWASRTLGVRQHWHLKHFSNPYFERIDRNQLVEEEGLPNYVATRYYAVLIGELLASRYQVVGKLGFGSTSTVWLARDLKDCRHVALKIFIHSASSSNDLSHEFSAYQRLERGPKSHPGRKAVRTLLDSFLIPGPDGSHQCFVHAPLWDSVATFLARNPVGKLPIPILGVLLQQLFRALDYIRTCQIIHTGLRASYFASLIPHTISDIKAGNILFGVEDLGVFDNFEQAELDHPTPRKEINGRIVYLSRPLDIPIELGLPVLCDFGSVEWGEEIHEKDVQPDVYRSPEVILKVPWSYEIDIWNVGCMASNIELH